MATRKYKDYKKQVSYDGGDTWTDVLPIETIKMPVYNETCTVPYAARIWVETNQTYKSYGLERRLPPMDILTKEAVGYLTDGCITSALYVGTGVTEIGASAFTHFSGLHEGYPLETVVFEEPSSVETIRRYAFYHHPHRESIIIPDSVKTIEELAFGTNDYTKLRYVEIGSGCTYIGELAFADDRGSSGGKIFVMKGNTPPQLGQRPFDFETHYQDGVNYDKGWSYVVIVPENALSAYREAWSGFSGSVISDTSLGNSAKAQFNMYEQSSTVCTLPNDGSTAISKSDIPVSPGNTKILTWLKIGDSIKSIPDGAFDGYRDEGIRHLTYLNLGNSVEEIGVNAFRFTPIRDLVIPDSVKTIGSGAFYYCEAMRTLKIGSGCTTIGSDAFCGCGIMTLELPDSIERLESNAFSCLNLRIGRDFKLPKSLKYIGNRAFTLENPVRMEILEIPSGVTFIDEESITSFSPNTLIIGENVNNISGLASSIATVVLPKTPPLVTNESYYDYWRISGQSTSLIYVEDSVVDTYKTTYGWSALSAHTYPMSELPNILNFADGVKFCGLYNTGGGRMYTECGSFKYGEYDGNTTLTSGETVWNPSEGYSSGGPVIIWIGDNVEYVNEYSFPLLNVPKTIIYGTGLKEFVLRTQSNNNYYMADVYVFKTTTPPVFSCDNYYWSYDEGGSIITGTTVPKTSADFYVPDSAVETYRNWLKEAGVITYRKGALREGVDNGDYIPTDDFNVHPLSEFCGMSGYPIRRWVETTGYECDGTIKYNREKQQMSTNWGVTWTDTGLTRRGNVILEPMSEDCGYVPPTPPTPTSGDYLTFTAIDSGTFKFSGDSIDYSLDNGTTWTSLASDTDSPTVVAGNKILWKATGLTPQVYRGIGRFSSTGSFTVEGNVMSLYYGDDFVGQTDLTGKDFAFRDLFSGCTGLTSAENLSLPATTLADNCYDSMFQFCESLTTAPVLSATTLEYGCYSGMFAGCTSLTTAPNLPATTLASYCYVSMFARCTSLIIAPDLPATTLASDCYESLFEGCTNLSYIKCLATDISAEDCTRSWLGSVSSIGTFVKASSMTGWSSGADGIPSNWTVQNA